MSDPVPKRPRSKIIPKAKGDAKLCGIGCIGGGAPSGIMTVSGAGTGMGVMPIGTGGAPTGGAKGIGRTIGGIISACGVARIGTSGSIFISFSIGTSGSRLISLRSRISGPR
jgi:hypothetical protein